jgi:hypothetical protein
MRHAVKNTHTRWKTKLTIICPAFSVTLRDALADNTQTSRLCICVKLLFETQDLCPPCMMANGKERLSKTMCNVYTDAINGMDWGSCYRVSANMDWGGCYSVCKHGLRWLLQSVCKHGLRWLLQCLQTWIEVVATVSANMDWGSCYSVSANMDWGSCYRVSANMDWGSCYSVCKHGLR